MNNEGFVGLLVSNPNISYQIMLQQFDWWKMAQGTKVQVSRILENTKYRHVYGSIANSTLPDDRDAERFPYVILISMNDMKKIFQKSADPLQFYDNKSELKIGDILIFSRNGQEYKWKITEVQSFGESEEVLNQYSISGLNEIISNQ